jgi:hypothetical protein
MQTHNQPAYNVELWITNCNDKHFFSFFLLRKPIRKSGIWCSDARVLLKLNHSQLKMVVPPPNARKPIKTCTVYSSHLDFIYFVLRHGARGLWPKDEKESKKGETLTAANETRKHTSK